jgi:hypothetical protein
MLTVYTYKIPKPAGCFDLSILPLDKWMDTVLDITAHQTTGVLWFGYLDGWMLTPHEEVVLRKAIRQFNCILITQFPFSLSQAWKNEIDWVYTVEPNGSANTHNNGRLIHDGGSPQHRHASSGSSPYGFGHQDRKAGSSEEGIIKARPHQAKGKDNST